MMAFSAVGMCLSIHSLIKKTIESCLVASSSTRIHNTKAQAKVNRVLSPFAFAFLLNYVLFKTCALSCLVAASGT